MTNNTQAGTPLEPLLDDDEWEKQQEEYEAHVEELSKSLRPCPQHGNPASIDEGYEGELSILAVECGCWLKAEYYDSIDLCVWAWNNQPQIDALTAQLGEASEQRDNYQESVANLATEMLCLIDERDKARAYIDLVHKAMDWLDVRNDVDKAMIALEWDESDNRQ